MVTTALATSRSRSRSRTRWRSTGRSDQARHLPRPSIAALACLLTCAGACRGDDLPPRTPVAHIETEAGPLTLDRSVVDHIAARDGLSAADAREQALDTLRLVATHRAEVAERSGPSAGGLDDLPPQIRERIERAAMVRLWLAREFEPEHEAQDIPRRVIDANMKDPRVARRLFHPEVWAVCQALIVPAVEARAPAAMVPGTGEPGEALESPESERWYAAAELAFAPALTRVRRVEDHLSDDDCQLFSKLIGLSERRFSSDSGEFLLRYERFAFAPSDAQSFDQTWVAAVTRDGGRGEHAIVGPFRSQFGVHLVIVDRINAANLADGSLPPAALREARELQIREEIEARWRQGEFQSAVEEMSSRRVVRMAPALERGQ